MEILKSVRTWWNNTTSDEKMITPVDPRMYLILREDLAYKYIQGGHALAQYALEHPSNLSLWNNEYLICLSVFNGLALAEVAESLKGEFIMSEFYEPDLQSDLPTAIAIFESGSGDIADILSSLRLATK